jgi:hypothetical protein
VDLTVASRASQNSLPDFSLFLSRPPRAQQHLAIAPPSLMLYSIVAAQDIDANTLARSATIRQSKRYALHDSSRALAYQPINRRLYDKPPSISHEHR